MVAILPNLYYLIENNDFFLVFFHVFNISFEKSKTVDSIAKINWIHKSLEAKPTINDIMASYLKNLYFKDYPPVFLITGNDNSCYI